MNLNLMSRRLPVAVLAALTASLMAAQAARADVPKPPQTPKPAATPVEPPAATQHVLAATALAKADLTEPLFLCRADSTNVVKQNLEVGSKKWVEPTKILDNLYYVGNEFVGVLVLRTSAGLVLFDSSSSSDEAEHHLVPGLVQLGLNPKDIKYVVVTHGHWGSFRRRCLFAADIRR